MGIKASATCVMNFDEAVGWLVGAPHKGMRAMFTMMNTARLGVGIQGLGIAEVSYQNALAYARDRLQGRSATGAKAPDKPADPDHRPPRRAQEPHDHAGLYRGRARPVGVGGAGRRSRGAAPRSGGAAGGRRIRGAADADGESLLHRHRLRGGEHRRPGLRRARLHPRARDGTVRPRRPHRPALRGHERHAGAGPGGPQAAAGHGPAAAPLLPSGVGLP